MKIQKRDKEALKSLNILVLAKNRKNYVSGYYHNDLVEAISLFGDVFLYGEGYPDYGPNDTIEDVIAKSPWQKNNIDLVVVGTSWGEESEDIKESDPHPRINLSSFPAPKIFFLNKEYKKIKQKLTYIKRSKFDIVVTVLPQEVFYEWEKITGSPFIQSHFGIDLKRFRYLGLPRIYDFTFTGSLHQKYTDLRQKAKEHLFKRKFLSAESNQGISRLLCFVNPIKKTYQKYSIYWAEWGILSRNFFGKSLLPSGEKYVELMNKTKVFFNTLSAKGIFNTRFFELMATKTLIFCPEDNYYGILKNGYNAIMFKSDFSDFDEKLRLAIESEAEWKRIVENAYKESHKHTYKERLKRIFQVLGIN